MLIGFANSKLQRICSSAKEIHRKWGPQIGMKIQARLQQLEALDSLADVRQLPGLRCHELKAEREGSLSIDLVHPHRLVFRPADQPRPIKADGGLDWTGVKAITIEEVVDYH